MQTVLTIAGFDPSSGAGVTADLMVFAAHGLLGTSAITALTVQSTLGVRSTHPVPADLLRDTLDCLHTDLPPAGIKIGMLANGANVAVLCDYLERLRGEGAVHGRVPVVLDPVIRSTSGRELLDPEGIELLRDRLLPLVDWVTPNLDELAELTGLEVRTHADVPGAAHALQHHSGKRSQAVALSVLCTGGHLEPPDDFLLCGRGEETWLPGVRVDSRATHGTGCALSSALLSRLALGDSKLEAARSAKEYVVGAIAAASLIGSGHCGINYLWNKRHSKL